MKEGRLQRIVSGSSCVPREWNKTKQTKKQLAILTLVINVPTSIGYIVTNDKIFKDENLKQIKKLSWAIVDVNKVNNKICVE